MFESRSVQEVVAGLCAGADASPSDERLVQRLVEAAAVVAWAESVALSAVAELRRRRQDEHDQLVAELGAEGLGGRPADGDEVDRFVAAEVAAAVRLSHRAAVDRVGLARDLVESLPATLAAMGRGLVSIHHARALRDATEVLDAATRTSVEAHVLPRAERSTPAQTTALARRAAARLDPAAAARRCELARERRRTSSWAAPDGMSVLQVTGPAETVAGAWARVDFLARAAQDAARAARRSLEVNEPLAPQEATVPAGGPDGVPTLEQLWADITLQLLAGTHDLTDRSSPGVAVSVDVLVPIATLLGASEEPAELVGLGPVPAAVARALAADARWQLVLDATRSRAGSAGACPASEEGGPGMHGPTSYRPSAALAWAIRARDVTCRFPGCRRAARACDLDHTVPHPDGPTAGCNLACLCRMHHRVKHRAGWRMEQLGQGRIRWTSPAGAVAETEPPGWEGPAEAGPASQAA